MRSAATAALAQRERDLKVAPIFRLMTNDRGNYLVVRKRGRIEEALGMSYITRAEAIAAATLVATSHPNGGFHSGDVADMMARIERGEVKAAVA